MFVQKDQRFIPFERIAWEDQGDGLRRKVMAYGDQLMGVYVEFKKGAIGIRHSHPHVQLAYVASGSFKVHIGDETKVLRMGDFFFLPSGVEHGVEALEDAVLVDVFTPMREDFISAAK